MSVLVGTSGWHYPAGRGTWNGIFYPASRPRGFDDLAWYAEHFDAVEVNSTFYRMPEPDMSRAWLRRTPASFQFAVKLYQQFTHPDMYLARAGVSDWDVSRTEVDLFRRGIDPMVAAGRLSAVLVQFPPSFHAGDAARGYLDWLLDALKGTPLAVELRHRTWSDVTVATRALLDAHDAAWALIDEPKFTSSVRQAPPPSADAPGGAASARHALAYIRLHGRNAAQWWDHAESEDRYDYLYSAVELKPFAEIARKLAERNKRVHLFLNNHFSAKAVANAAVLKHQLGQPLPGDYPAAMVDRYPELSGIVTTSGLPL